VYEHNSKHLKIITMSLLSGNVTATVLQNIRVEIEAARADKVAGLQYKPLTTAPMDAVKAVETMTIASDFANPTQDDKVEITSINACALELQTTLSDCDTGTFKEASSQKVEYNLTKRSQVLFQVKEKDLRGNDVSPEMALAKLFARSEVMIFEQMQKDILTTLNAAKGVNLFNGGKGTVVANDTYVPVSNWTSELYPYLNVVMAKNRFENGVFLSPSEKLMTDYIKTGFEAGNSDGSGGVQKYNSLPTFFDLQLMDTVNDSDKISYMLALGSVLFVAKPVYSTTPERLHDHDRFSYQSSLYPGLWINAQVYDACDGNFVTKKVKLFTYHDLFVNPTGCDVDNKGILTFICGNAPSVS
jgi:hypothetical protein